MGLVYNKIKSYDVVSYYKDNTEFFYNQYINNTSKDVRSIPINGMFSGGLFFLFYMDESNWMQYSPIFLVEYKDKMLFAVNFNFIPFEIRAAIFDDILLNFNDNNQFSNITFESMYKLLYKYGYEYAIVEYSISRVRAVYHIDISLITEFIYSIYPKNKYDPYKLYDIWSKKIKTKEARHQELIKTIVSDFYNTKADIIDESNELKGKFQRLKRNQDKFGL